MQISLFRQFDLSSRNQAERSGRGRGQEEKEPRGRGRAGFRAYSHPVGGAGRSGVFVGGRVKEGVFSLGWSWLPSVFLAGALFFFLIVVSSLLFWGAAINIYFQG